MAECARAAGWVADSIDYQGIDDPAARVAKLLAEAQGRAGPLVLAGSSMGGHVAAAGAAPLNAKGLFLLAPAFYMPGLEALTPREIPCRTAIVHGWRDTVVPVENSIRWAREQGATLHILDGDHRLQEQIAEIRELFGAYLGGCI
jgi:alpha/beta superfamily hydrolase